MVVPNKEMTIPEKNELIATFMELERIDAIANGYVPRLENKTGPNGMAYVYKHPFSSLYLFPSELEYPISWDWFMGAYKKICTLSGEYYCNEFPRFFDNLGAMKRNVRDAHLDGAFECLVRCVEISMSISKKHITEVELKKK